MYGLPADFDPSFLVGWSLIQVCIGENEVVLHFADDESPPAGLTVIVTADVVVGDGGSLVRHVDAKDAGVGLLPVLGRSTTAASGDADGTLHLDFGECFIELLDSEERYESYVIEAGGRTIVV